MVPDSGTNGTGMDSGTNNGAGLVTQETGCSSLFFVFLPSQELLFFLHKS